MTNQRLSELRHKGYITNEEYKDIKNALTAIDEIRTNILFLIEKCLPNNLAEGYEIKGLKEALDIVDRCIKGETE